MRFSKTFFYNYLPFNDWATNALNSKLIVDLDMCYFWDDLATAETHGTIFGWQRSKQKDEITNDHEDQRQECDLTNKKLREVILDYFNEPTA